MYKVVIIEDEKIAADNLARMLGQIDASFVVVERIESVKEGLKKLPVLDFDLLFLDIHLSDGNAFELLRNIEITKPIIFTTAYDQYVLRAFKYLSIDYLLKPVGKDELATAIQKFRDHFLPQTEQKVDLSTLQALLNQGGGFKERFLIQIGKKLKPVLVEQVLYFYSMNKITFLKTREGKSFPVDYSLTQLEKELDPNQFFRTNRQYLIARSAIQHIYIMSPTKMQLILISEPDLDVYISIDRIGKFKSWMK